MNITANSPEILSPEEVEDLLPQLEQVAIMQGLTAAHKIIRDAQFGMASAAPIVWDMLERMLKHNQKQQAEALAAIRS